jgi:phospholipid/cholesterol/gamma-HCH transport system substrate-binding protein
VLKPESRAISRSFKVGVGGLIVIGLLTYLTLAAQYGNPFTPKTYVTAVFHDVHALQLKDPVRQNSKGIGRITDIQYRNGLAVVTLQIEEGGDYPIYRDATAFIGDQSAVGSKYVGINPGTPGTGPLPDMTIPVSRTKDAHDITQVLNIFDPHTRAGTMGFLRQFGGGMTGQADGFTDFVHNAPDDLHGIGTISEALASSEANLPSLLSAADQLAGRFRGREPQIASLISQTEQTFDAIAVDNAKPLADTINQAPATLDEVRKATDSLDTPLADGQIAVTDLEPGFKGLGDSNDDLRGTFRESVPVFHQVPDVADQTTPALKDLTPTASDLRPLAPKVTRFVNDFSTPLEVLAPYSKEIGYLFVRGNSFVSEGTANGVHYARLNGNFQAPYTAFGGVVKACHPYYDPYPKPGQADRDQVGFGFKHMVPCGVQVAGLQHPVGDN